MRSKKTNRACVYDIVYKGEVVYVGMTNNPDKRLVNHLWTGVAPKGAILSVHKWYSTREEAFKEERKREAELMPVHMPRRDRSPKKPFGVTTWDDLRKLFKRWYPKMSDADLDEVVELNRQASCTEACWAAHERLTELAAKSEHV